MRHDEEGGAVAVTAEVESSIPIPNPILLHSPAIHIVFITHSHCPVAAVDVEASRTEEVTANSI